MENFRSGVTFANFPSVLYGYKYFRVANSDSIQLGNGRNRTKRLTTHARAKLQIISLSNFFGANRAKTYACANGYLFDK